MLGATSAAAREPQSYALPPQPVVPVRSQWARLIGPTLSCTMQARQVAHEPVHHTHGRRTTTHHHAPGGVPRGKGKHGTHSANCQGGCWSIGRSGAGADRPGDADVCSTCPRAGRACRTSPGDDVDYAAACTAAPNDCSLRGAIEKANGDAANSYIIRFASDYAIRLDLPLTITANDLVIRGETPALWPRSIKVNAADHGQAFVIEGVGDQLVGLRIYGAAEGTSNIYVADHAYGAVIAGCVIGDDDGSDGCQTGSPNAHGGIYIASTGVSPLYASRAWIYGNVIECNRGSQGNGIDVSNTDNVVIGADPSIGWSSEYRNHIRSNAGAGIAIAGSWATNIHIDYNYIGVNSVGSAAASPPNGTTGIEMSYLSSNTVITGNLISGNGWAGVWLNNAHSVTVTSNYIGTNAPGTAAVPNGHDGVALTYGARSNSIGGIGGPEHVAFPNLISGNTLCGVRIRDGATSNVVDGNWIGLSATGVDAIPNGEAGVAVLNANGNVVGTSWYGVSQYISGNGREGVYVEDSDATIIAQTNRIGVACDYISPLGNGRDGVKLVNATNSFVLPTFVLYNGGAGIALEGPPTAIGNKLSPAVVYANTGLPIDLGSDGPTLNDSGDGDTGPNYLLNYPAITAASGSIVTGTVCANCAVHLYEAFGDPARPGGGGRYVGIVHANAAGAWTATLPYGLTRARVTLQACAPPCTFSGDTSEFSPRPTAYLPLSLRGR